MNLAGEQMLRQVFDSIEDYAVIVTDDSGVVIAANAGVQPLLGYTEAELVGGSSDVIFTPEDRSADVPLKERELATSTGRASDNRWHLRKDGSRVWMNGILTDVRNPEGELIGFAKVMQDRTEERLTEESLRLSEARYRSLLDDVLDVFAVGVVILDAQGEVVWINRAVAHYFGLERANVIGRSERELRRRLTRLVKVPDDFTERLESLQGDGEKAVRMELRLEGNGETGDLWLEHRSEQIRSGPFEGGRIEHYYDISARKRTEQALARARDDLETEVSERTADLLTLNEELESFNYSVSHDLRSPLRGLTGYSQILLEEYGDRLDDRGRHFLSRVSLAAVRMGELIDALLALSRVSRRELSFDQVDLSEIASEIAQGLRDRDAQREVEFDITPGVVVHGDERLLRIVLENLLNNAWKFTLEVERPRIGFGAREEPGGRPVLFVRDNGAGFDMRFAEKLFVPFQRLHSPKRFTGTGIGLATVQRIVHRHGGRVWAESEVGAGATFYFTLPAAPD